MKKLTILLLLLYNTAFSQTSYYRYNSAGVPEKVGYSEPTNNQLFAPYQSKVDAGTYYQVGAELQRRFDENLKSIQSLLNDINGIFNEIYPYNQSYVTESTKNVKDYINSLGRADFAKPAIYNEVYNTLYKYKLSIAEDRKDIIEQYYKAKYSK